jgi:hypothetical protein
MGRRTGIVPVSRVARRIDIRNPGRAIALDAARRSRAWSRQTAEASSLLTMQLTIVSLLSISEKPGHLALRGA